LASQIGVSVIDDGAVVTDILSAVSCKFSAVSMIMVAESVGSEAAFEG
jgi:hypothetical protein